MGSSASRPPAVAQQRFAARRAEFRGLDLGQKFRRIHEINLWGADSSVSGLGSELAATAALRAQLPGLLRELGIRSLLDAPCGDHRWLAETDLALESYIGLDIVPEVVDAAATRNAHVAWKRFLVGDLTRDPLPRCDLVLNRDCLVHFSFATLARALDNLRASGADWLLTTTFPDLERNLDIEDADWRPLNFERAPFGWPAPVACINEGCTEAEGAYADKSLALWRLADVRLPEAR